MNVVIQIDTTNKKERHFGVAELSKAGSIFDQIHAWLIQPDAESSAARIPEPKYSDEADIDFSTEEKVLLMKLVNESQFAPSDATAVLAILEKLK